jgi:hypothetical protein
LIKLQPKKKKKLAIEINKYYENMEGRTLTARIKVMVIGVESNLKNKNLYFFCFQEKCLGVW